MKLSLYSKGKKGVFLCFITLCGFFLLSCEKRSGVIDLSSAPLLLVDSQWALVMDPYALYRSEPSVSATTASYGRRGDLQEVKGQRIVTEKKQQVIWYQFESGWLPDSSVQIYSNELKARSAAKNLELQRSSSQ